MTALPTLAAHLGQAFRAANRQEKPFRYWLLQGVLPGSTAQAICALPLATPFIGDTRGRRETHNDSRIFFAPDQAARFPVIATVATTFQDRDMVQRIEACFSQELAGGFLRIEYCLDSDGFWLEPHTDISAKLLTMLIYLSDDPDADAWGTDLYDADMRLVGRAPGAFNKGLVFIPAGDTWHGFARRPMHGVRRSLIINYVRPDWRSRHELCFPDRPCMSGKDPGTG